MANIFSLYGSIFIDNEKANKSIDETTKKGSTAGSKVGAAFSSIAKGAVKIGSAIIGAAGAAGGALIGVTENTREYRNEMAKLETAYTTAGHSTAIAEATYRSLYSVLGETDQAVEASNHLAKLCQNEEQLSYWTNICTGVYATFGNSLPIEGLAEAANETAKVGQVTGSLADALNWAGVSEDDFNSKLEKCSTEQERQALITETLNGLYSESATKYKELNKDIISSNEAQAKLTKNMAKLGGVAEPVIAKVKGAFASLLENMLPIAEKMAVTLLPPLMMIIEQLLPTLVVLIHQTVPAASELITTLLPPLIDLAQVILPVLIDLIMQILPPCMEIITAVLPVITQLLEMLLPPILQIVEMVLPLLLSLITPILPLLEPILALLQPLIDLLMAIITPLVQILDAILPPLIEIISKTIEIAIVPLQGAFTVLAGILSGTVTAAFSLIQNNINTAKGVFNGLIDFVKNVFTGNWKGAWNSVVNIFSTVFSGIKNAFKVPINWIIDGINAFIKGLNSMKVPDWVPGVGGKSFNIKTIPRLRVGIDYVPYDEFPALLHKGEKVLTASEAKEHNEQRNEKRGKETAPVKLEMNLNIENFVNKSDKDIKSLIDEIMQLIEEYLRRKGVVWA